MAGGEVVRQVAVYGPGAGRQSGPGPAAVPYLYRSYDNPEGWLDDADIARLTTGLSADRLGFLDRLMTDLRNDLAAITVPTLIIHP